MKHSIVDEEDNFASSNSEDESISESGSNVIKDNDTETESDSEDEIMKRIEERRNEYSQNINSETISTRHLTTDICFHRNSDILALSNVIGDVSLYKYGEQMKIDLLGTTEVHSSSCRAIDFTMDGNEVVSVSKDKCICLVDAETLTLKAFWDTNSSLNTVRVLRDDLFITGDEEGCAKLWDKRRRQHISSQKLSNLDSILSFCHSERFKKVAVMDTTGTVSIYDFNGNCLQRKSTLSENEVSCMNLFRNESKIVCGTSDGQFLFINWDICESSYKPMRSKTTEISSLLAVSENMAVYGCDDGCIRSTFVMPNQPIGIIGRHISSMPVMKLDISHDGQTIGSLTDNEIKLWRISCLENVQYLNKKSKNCDKDKNLPSSNVLDRQRFFEDLGS